MNNRQTVYVVMASRGEDADREEWICAVVTDAGAAMAMVDAKYALARAAEVRFRVYDRQWQEHRQQEDDFEAFKAKHGPPPNVEADTYWAVAVPLEQWGKWPRWHDAEVDE